MNYKSIILGILTSFIIGIGIILVTRKLSLKSLEASPSELHQELLNQKESVPAYDFNDFSLLRDYVQEKPGVYGIYIENVNTKEIYTLNENESFYGASLYKILVAGAVYKKLSEDVLSTNYLYTYNSSDYETGTGLLQNYSPGSTYTVDDLLDYLLKHSDNIAQNIFTRNIRWDEIDAFYMEYSEQSPSINSFSANNYTNPKEVSKILLNIYRSDTLSKELRRDFFTRMTNTEFEDRISQELSSSLTFSHKIGNAPQYNSWHDCGIVFNSDFTDPVVVCLMSKNTTYEEFIDSSKAIASFLNQLY